MSSVIARFFHQSMKNKGTTGASYGLLIAMIVGGVSIITLTGTTTGDVFCMVAQTIDSEAACDTGGGEGAGGGGNGGEAGGGNNAPAISDISDDSIDENGAYGPVAFTINDEDGDSMTLSATSSNPALVPSNRVVFGGSGDNRTISITPEPNESGSTAITVTVDDGTDTSQDTFVLTVTPDASPTFVSLGINGDDDPAAFRSTDGTNWSTHTVATNGCSPGGISFDGTTYAAITCAPVDATEIYLSSDGQNWSLASGTIDVYSSYSDLVYGGGKFVGISNGCNAAVSTNGGIDWNEYEESPCVEGEGIAYGNGNFVIAGYSGIASSPDGETWTNITPSVTYNGYSDFGDGLYLDDIIYANGKFVAAGYDDDYNPFVVYALGSDLSTWHVPTLPTPSDNDHDLYSIGYGNGMWVVGGWEGALFTSTDLETWTEQDSGIESDIYDISYAGGIFVAIGDFDHAIYSSDGETWTPSTTHTNSGSSNSHIVGGNPAANGGASDPSADTGINSAPTISDIANAQVEENEDFGPVAFTIGDEDGDSLTVTATSSNHDVVTDENITIGGSGNSRTISASVEADSSGSTTITVTVSDGILSSGDTFTLTVGSIAATANYVGIAGSDIVTSPDAVTWTQTSVTGSSYLRGLAFDGVNYVVGDAGGSGGLYISSDLESWTQTLSGTNIYAVAAGNGRIVAIEEGGNNSYASTNNGSSWISGSAGGSPQVHFVDLAYGDGVFVAVAHDTSGDSNNNGDTSYQTILSSTNGISWTTRETLTPDIRTGAYDEIVFGGGKFVAVGGFRDPSEDRVAYADSTGLDEWDHVSPPVSFNAVAYGQSKFLAVGTGGAVYQASPSNLSSWSSVGSIPSGTSWKLDFVDDTWFSMDSDGDIEEGPGSAIVYTSSNGSSWSFVNQSFDNAAVRMIGTTYTGGSGGGSSNNPPYVQAMADEEIYMNETVYKYPEISDPDEDELTVTGTSSNQALVQDSNIVITGVPFETEITITPETDAFGTATITITADDGTDTTSESFLITISGNNPPTISDISSSTIGLNATFGPTGFTVSDVETAAESLVVTATSNNQTLVPDGNITLGGSGENRTIEITPATDEYGTATITVTVDDGEHTTDDIFNLTVTSTPPNTPPTITAIDDGEIPKNDSYSFQYFTVGDDLTPDINLTLSAVSSNTTLVQNGNITFGNHPSDDSQRSILVVPENDLSGTTTITVTVDDGEHTTDTQFDLTVTDSNCGTGEIDFAVVGTGGTLLISTGNGTCWDTYTGLAADTFHDVSWNLIGFGDDLIVGGANARYHTGNFADPTADFALADSGSGYIDLAGDVTGNGYTVSVKPNSNVISTQYGGSWTDQSINGNSHSLYLSMFHYGDDEFVLIGNGDYATGSPGTSWTYSSSGPSVSGGAACDVHESATDTYVCVGSGGKIWSGTSPGNLSLVSSPTSENLNGVAHRGLFLAVGDNGTILTSSNGTSWNVRTSPTSENLNAAVHSPNASIIVGDNGTILRTFGGCCSNWTSYDSHTTEDLLGVFADISGGT